MVDWKLVAMLEYSFDFKQGKKGGGAPIRHLSIRPRFPRVGNKGGK